MAKSSSLKKLDKAEQYQRVSAWARNELDNIRKSSRAPICVKLANGNYTVGRFLVEQINGYWYVGNTCFNAMRNAIFYAALTHINKTEEATQLMELDQRAANLEFDKEAFRFRLDKAHLAQDEWKIGLYSSRFEEAKGRLRLIRQEVEKILKRNKYLNILG